MGYAHCRDEEEIVIRLLQTRKKARHRRHHIGRDIKQRILTWLVRRRGGMIADLAYCHLTQISPLLNPRALPEADWIKLSGKFYLVQHGEILLFSLGRWDVADGYKRH